VSSGKKGLLEEAVKLAIEPAEQGWGGTFGAVMTSDGEIMARGQNRVLLTGDCSGIPPCSGMDEAVKSDAN
jgi:tRNA(Arg) A34 adenosine deaminase TadA